MVIWKKEIISFRWFSSWLHRLFYTMDRWWNHSFCCVAICCNNHQSVGDYMSEWGQVVFDINWSIRKVINCIREIDINCPGFNPQHLHCMFTLVLYWCTSIHYLHSFTGTVVLSGSPSVAMHYYHNRSCEKSGMCQYVCEVMRYKTIHIPCHLD